MSSVEFAGANAKVGPNGAKPASASAKADVVLRRDEGAICWLTINRPQRGNSICKATHQALMAHLEALRDNRKISVIVLSGGGERFFCTGHDLADVFEGLEPAAAAAELMEGAELMRAFRAQPQIIIARVEGIAAGAGLQLVAGADLAVAARTARFTTPGVNIGLWCYGPMVDLSRNVAPKHAMQMLATGALVDAEFACQIGLVNQVVESADLDSAVRELAQQIASKSSKTFEMGKPAFYAQLALPVDEAYKHAAQVKAEHVSHVDAREGVQSFLEKRSPNWKGR